MRRLLLHAAAFLSLLAGTCALYQGALHLGFLDLDDPTYVLENPLVRRLDGESLGRVLTEPYFANYSPTHLLSYSLDYSVRGPDPFVFHLSNALWAGLVAGTVYLLGLGLLGGAGAALLGAALFVVHPAHVEAVAWISSRNELVAAAFALASLLAYRRYRRRAPGDRLYYGVSFLLFTLAVGGKTSAVVLPAVLLFHDLWVEGRPLRRSIADKIPFALVACAIGLRALAAQPTARPGIDLSVAAWSIPESLGLLSGFGTFVLYRDPPPTDPSLDGQVFGGLVLLLLLAAPVLLRRRIGGLSAFLLVSLVLSLLPPQGLSLVHPVADRYLFLPSVFVVLLLAVGARALARRFGRPGTIAAAAACIGLAGLWVKETLSYLSEGEDPRSVWFAASTKSSEPNTFFHLGAQYQARADRLEGDLAKGGSEAAACRRLASAVWEGNPRLAALLSEWDRAEFKGEETKALRDGLLDLASVSFDRTVATKRTLMPHVFYRLGKIAVERGRSKDAREAFEKALEESRRHTYEATRNEFEVRCGYALGVVAWRERKYSEALPLIRSAEEAQQRYGGNWEPELSAQRRRLEGIASRPGR
ncbi:MAG: hypothetical protein L0323_10750 [Planctomycetes bacterium]|nr:hypothetical protein [Planctomycetota bacterium]